MPSLIFKIWLPQVEFFKNFKTSRLRQPIPESEAGHYVKLCLGYAYFLLKNETRDAYKKTKHVNHV